MHRLSMRSCLVPVFLTLILVLPAAPAAAQTSVSINSGATIPTGDYADFYGVSYNGSASMDFVVSDHIAVGGRIGYHSATLKGQAILEDLGLAGVGLAVRDGAASLRTFMPTVRVFQRVGPAELYGIAGLGFVRAHADGFTVFSRGSSVFFPGSDENAVSMEIGGGARLPSGPFSIFGEFDYLIAFTTSQATTTIPARFGISYTFGWRPTL